ncbi:MAG TPA: TonB family protein, partial [Bacteroidia bacterium]
PPPPPPPPPPTVRTVQFTPPKPSEQDDDKPPPKQEDIKDQNLSDKDREGADGPPPPPEVHNDVVDDNQVYNNAELGEQAEFPGGMTELFKFLQKNIHYPEFERQEHISGKSILTFVVEKDGSISDVQVVKGVPGGPGCDKEAVRVVKIMPKWNPGKQNGHPVRVKYALPVKFSLSGGE